MFSCFIFLLRILILLDCKKLLVKYKRQKALFKQDCHKNLLYSLLIIPKVQIELHM